MPCCSKHLQGVVICYSPRLVFVPPLCAHTGPEWCFGNLAFKTWLVFCLVQHDLSFFCGLEGRPLWSYLLAGLAPVLSSLSCQAGCHCMHSTCVLITPQCLGFYSSHLCLVCFTEEASLTSCNKRPLSLRHLTSLKITYKCTYILFYTVYLVWYIYTHTTRTHTPHIYTLVYKLHTCRIPPADCSVYRPRSLLSTWLACSMHLSNEHMCCERWFLMPHCGPLRFLSLMKSLVEDPL